MLRRTAGNLLRATSGLAAPSRAGVQATRRRALIARVRAAAIWNDATVDIQIDRDAHIGRDVQVSLQPWTHNVLHVGAGSMLGDNVLVQLKGGAVLIADGVHVRRGAILNVAGRLVCSGENLIGWNTVIHCSTAVSIGRKTTIAEQVTVADSSHYFTTPDDHVWYNVRTGSVVIGENTWICAKATLTRDSSVGSHCIVAANSVVTGEVPDGSLASGVPASVRPLRLPWVQGEAPAGF